jgi:hypothetical protein
MIMMDLFYLENMSILLDLKIMLKTGAVIAGQLLESSGDTTQSLPEQIVQSLKEEVSQPAPQTPRSEWDSKPIGRLRPRLKQMGLPSTRE